MTRAKVHVADITCAGIYDSFTVTLTMLLEELGLAGRGEAGARAALMSSTSTAAQHPRRTALLWPLRC